jgi:signal peptide peptidase SppA
MFKSDKDGGLLGGLRSRLEGALEPALDKALGAAEAKAGSKVAVIRLEGQIAAGGGGGLGGNKSLNLKSVRPRIKEAFNEKGLVAVALSINSPGGSPVQSDLIAREIRYFAEKKNIPVFTFVEDMAASGGYWLACAGDEIYALPSSITGSIGVIGGGFGFDKLMAKVGVERRIYTAGKNKSSLDPFRPENPDDVKKIQELQGKIHEDFKNWVKLRRGSKLTSADPKISMEDKLMNGGYWTTADSQKFGLVDGVGELEATMRKKFGESINIDYGKADKPNLMQLLSGLTGARAQGSSTIGEDAVDQLLHRIEERARWNKFGL